MREAAASTAPSASSEIYDAMQRAIDTGEPYRTRLDPPPADPRLAHGVETMPEWVE